jgi:2-polyprenyl-3-methyl-5-hydroxy-6-metoxy-1,4-benzoquinol methylase
MAPTLSANDYDESYALPDHWVMHERDPDGMFTRLHGYYINRVVEILKRSGATSVLEVGCGDGWACGQLVKAGLEVVGIDWSKNAVGYASIRVPGATFLCADARDPVLAKKYSNKFDASALIEVIEHIPPDDCVSALQNIGQYLKSGATFVLTTPSTNFPNTNPQHFRHFSEELIRDIISQSGQFVVTSVEGYGDMTAERAHWRMARWFDNRIYRVKPVHAALLRRLNRMNTAGPTALNRCHGFIVTMRRK